MLRPVDSDGELGKAEESDVKVKKARKTRTSFSSEQIRKLEAQFKENPYLSLQEREAVGQELGLEERSVYLYTEDHRRPAVYHGKLVIQTEEYVPVTLPCLPSHPGVQVRVHRWDWRRRALHHDFREASTNFR